MKYLHETTAIICQVIKMYIKYNFQAIKVFIKCSIVSGYDLFKLNKNYVVSGHELFSLNKNSIGSSYGA